MLMGGGCRMLWTPEGEAVVSLPWALPSPHAAFLEEASRGDRPSGRSAEGLLPCAEPCPSPSPLVTPSPPQSPWAQVPVGAHCAGVPPGLARRLGAPGLVDAEFVVVSSRRGSEHEAVTQGGTAACCSAHSDHAAWLWLCQG